MPQNYFNPGSWQPAPFNPGTGGDQYGFNPAPLPQPRYTPENPYAYYPQPTPGVEPGPYVPDNPSAVLDLRPGYVPGLTYGNPGGVPSSGLPFLGGVGSGEGFNWKRTGTSLLGGLLGGPIGSVLSKVIYDRFFGPDPAPFDAQTFPKGYTYDDYQRDMRTPNTFHSRRRPGSTRFSQGVIELSDLPIIGAPGSLMPAVFAGEKRTGLPGGQTVYTEQR